MVGRIRNCTFKFARTQKRASLQVGRRSLTEPLELRHQSGSQLRSAHLPAAIAKNQKV
jgi:hypothetical protein